MIWKYTHLYQALEIMIFLSDSPSVVSNSFINSDYWSVAELGILKCPTESLPEWTPAESHETEKDRVQRCRDVRMWEVGQCSSPSPSRKQFQKKNECVGKKQTWLMGFHSKARLKDKWVGLCICWLRIQKYSGIFFALG